LLLATRPDFGESGPSRYFGGYRCTEHCQTHSEGYQWARVNRIFKPGDCKGTSRSFIEGCRSFARDRVRDFTKDDDGHPIK
jgi:hypothetical protein